MAYKLQSSFAAGELDPALHERTTLEKYNSGLATARNVIVGKTGRIVSRGARKLFLKTKNSNERSLIYSPPSSGFLLEMGPLYFRIYSIDEELTGEPEGYLFGEIAHTITEAQLPSVHFDSSKSHIFVFCDGHAPYRIDPVNGALLFGFSATRANNTLVAPPTMPTTTVYSSTSTTGYPCEYAITRIQNGQESYPIYYSYDAAATPPRTFKIPLGVEGTTLFALSALTETDVSEIRVYRRPQNGGVYGYIGASAAIGTIDDVVGGANPDHIVHTFIDFGQDADYAHTPPTLNAQPTLSANYYPKTGTIYQQRLLLGNYTGEQANNPLREAIVASRTGYLGNFYRDYPISDDSSMVFKAGSSGYARVLRMIDNDGLVVFTSVGVFLHSGTLVPDNLTLVKKGNWIIDETVPPLSVPGGVLFVDKATNTVRALSWSNENQSFAGDELSIFSDHLFTGKQIKSWAYHSGDTPLLYVVYEDGTFSSLTYEREHQMRAWTRHDSTGVNVEYVTGSGLTNKTYFLVEKDGERYIEETLPRYVPVADSTANPEADKGAINAFMDSIVSWDGLLTPAGADEMALALAVGSATWEDPLTLTCGTSGLFPSPGAGAVGNTLRYFNPEDGASVDLVVTARASNNSITVQPNSLFPSEYALENPRIYNTTTTVTGLTHLEGEEVSVMIDGYVVASPNNDIEDYPSVEVTGASITLPSSLRGAIVHVGRPITADTETLDIDSVEQRPVFIESQTNNKLYVKVHRSRGLYAGHEFPEDNLVSGMEDLDRIDVNYEGDAMEEIIGNRYIAPQTRRYEITLPGDWDSQGKICLRQVDPVHFEILSIIPDIEDLRR